MSYRLKPFPSLMVYSIDGIQNLTKESLTSSLSQSIFTPCLVSDYSRVGWVSTTEKGSSPHILSDEDNLVCFYCSEVKNIQPSVVNSKVNELVNDWKRRSGYKKIKKSIRADIKRTVVSNEIKIVQTKKVIIPVWFDLKNKRLCIATRKMEEAEAVISLLRRDCQSMPAIPLIPEKAFESTLTAWVNGDMPEGFSIANNIELTKDKNVVKLEGDDLIIDSVNMFIEDGYRVTRVGIFWADRLSFQMQIPCLLWDMNHHNIDSELSSITQNCRELIDILLKVIDK